MQGLNSGLLHCRQIVYPLSPGKHPREGGVPLKVLAFPVDSCMCLPSLASLVLLFVFTHSLTHSKQTPHPMAAGWGRSQSVNLCSRLLLWPLNEPCAALISAWFPCSHACMFVAQSCPTLCDPLDHSAPGSSVPGILQARILGWVATSFSSIHLLEHKQKENPPRWRHRARV